MSEGVYDSDAQFVTTPQRVGQSPERPSTTASVGQRLSLTRRDNNQLRLSDLSEQSRELEVSNDTDLSPKRRRHSEEPGEPRSRSGSPCSTRRNSQLQAIPVSNSEVRETDTPRSASSTESAIDHPIYKKVAGGVVSFSQSPQSLLTAHNTELRTLTPLSNNVSEASNEGDSTLSQPVQNLGIVPRSINSRLASGSSDSQNERMSEIVVEKRRRQRGPGRVPTSIDERLASTGSSDSPNERMSEIIVDKRRRQTSLPEVRSIHLFDLNISKVLASPSITPRNLSQSDSLEGNQENAPSLRSVSDQGGAYAWEKRAEKAALTTRTASRSGYVSSVHSQRSTSSANASIEHLMPTACGFGAMNYRLNGSERTCSSTGDDITLPASNLNSIEGNESTAKKPRKSRFTERFDLDCPVPLNFLAPHTESCGDGGTRKISIGWMSGGRRLGYGYTMVDGNEESNPTSSQDSKSPLESGTDNAPDKPPVEDECRENVEKQPTVQKEETSSMLRESSVHTQATDNTCQRRWSGATTLLRAVKTKESTGSASTTRSLWTKLATHARRDRNGRVRIPDNASAAESPGPSAESLNTERDHHKKTWSLSARKHARLWAGIHHLKRLRLRRRSATDNECDQEKRHSVGDTFLSGGQHRPAVQQNEIEDAGDINSAKRRNSVEQVGPRNRISDSKTLPVETDLLSKSGTPDNSKVPSVCQRPVQDLEHEIPKKVKETLSDIIYYL